LKNRKCGKVAAFFLFFLIFSVSQVRAEGRSSTDIEFQITSLPEAKLIFSQSFTFPFLQGSGALTKDNNITTVLSAEVTPVSMNGKGEFIWTPLAFFLATGGGQVGSGWNMPLGNGIGINRPENENDPLPRKAKIDGSPFDGLLWATWGAGTLQFDLGAVIPGEWTHILFQTRQEFRYAAYSRAENGQSWVFENNAGENQNGWNYYAQYILGYQMPQSPVLDTIAFMAELEKPLYSTPGEAYWGGNLGSWFFSTLINFTVHPRLSAALVIQTRTYRNHGSSNFRNSDYFYQDLPIKNEEGQRRLLFYRAALIFHYKIR
jgi:hypothetical protein